MNILKCQMMKLKNIMKRLLRKYDIFCNISKLLKLVCIVEAVCIIACCLFIFACNRKYATLVNDYNNYIKNGISNFSDMYGKDFAHEVTVPLDSVKFKFNVGDYYNNSRTWTVYNDDDVMIVAKLKTDKKDKSILLSLYAYSYIDYYSMERVLCTPISDTAIGKNDFYLSFASSNMLPDCNEDGKVQTLSEFYIFRSTREPFSQSLPISEAYGTELEFEIDFYKEIYIRNE